MTAKEAVMSGSILGGAKGAISGSMTGLVGGGGSSIS